MKPEFITVRITAEMKTALRKVSGKEGRTVGDVVRRLLSEGLKEERKNAQKS